MAASSAPRWHRQEDKTGLGQDWYKETLESDYYPRPSLVSGTSW